MPPCLCHGEGSRLRQSSWAPNLCIPSFYLCFYLWEQFFGKQNLLTEMLSSILVFCQRFYCDFQIEEPLIMKGSQWNEPEEMPWSLTVPLFGTASLITFGGRGQHCEPPPFPPSKCQNILNCYQRQTVSSGLLRRGRHPGGVGSFRNASVAVTTFQQA